MVAPELAEPPQIRYIETFRRALDFERGKSELGSSTNIQYDQTRGIGDLEFADGGYQVPGRTN